MRPRIAICRHAAHDDASAVALALAHTPHAGIEISLLQDDPASRVETAGSLVTLSGGALDIRYHFPLGPLELSDPSPSGAQATLDAMMCAIDAVSKGPGNVLTVHAALPTSARSGPRFAATQSRLRHLVDAAADAGVTIALENLKWGATSDPDTVTSLADSTGARVTFDVGHANSSEVAAAGYSSETFARDLGGRIVGSHVYERETDTHLAPEDLDRIGDTLHTLCDVGCEWWTVELTDSRDASRTAAMLTDFVAARFGSVD